MAGLFSNLLWAAESATRTLSTFESLLYFLTVIAVIFVIPYFLGRWIATTLRMNDYGWKFGLIFGTLFASALILWPKPEFLGVGWPPKLGIDLKGGVILVYEVDAASRTTAANDDPGGQPGDPGVSQAIRMNDLIAVLSRRINPGGLKEIVVRPFGEKQVEIIIPDVDPLEIERIKRTIGQAGILEFRIVANGRDHATLIELATQQAQDPLKKRLSAVKDATGKEVGFWATAAREQNPTAGRKLFKVSVWRDTIRDARTGNLISFPDFRMLNEFDEQPARFVDHLESRGITDVEVLMASDDGQNVTGSDLGAVSTGFENLNPKVDFSTRTADAARRMGLLTGQNLPDGSFTRQLGIVLDRALISAPAIRGMISDRGQITGQFTQEEVNDLVEILRSGQLPQALNKEPVSENQIGSLLGQDMIMKSAFALILSLVLVLAFMLFYYRFAGIVACFALTMNLVLIVAIMVLIKAAFTLPGLAGLVLTVGMAVDANVLIFERMREEQARGAALRMVIRNGFDRAFITIIDSNLTTIITAVILYVIGTDQVKGFAITLTLGILTSMFTAVFCARVIFDTAERRRWITSLNMTRLMTTTNYDFMKIWKPMTAVSVAIIVIGLVATVVRGRGILDIDFLGGTSAEPLLKTAAETETIRAKLNSGLGSQNIQYTLTNVQVRGQAASGDLTDRVYKIDTSLKTIEELRAELIKILRDDQDQSLLATYSMDFTPPRAVDLSAGKPDAGKPDSGTPDADATKPSEPATDKPDESKPESKPAEETPAEAKPADAKPADTKPADEKPSDAKPTDEKPSEAKPSDAKPADAKPTAEKPAEVKPAEEKPADAKPADSKPAAEKPAEGKPTEEKPADNKPSEGNGGANPCDDQASDGKPADVQPAEEKPADAKPSEKPADEKPADEKPAEAKPAEAKPADEKPAEAKPTDEKPTEKPAEEGKPADAQPTSEKPADAPEAKPEAKPAADDGRAIVMESDLTFETRINAQTLIDRIRSAARELELPEPLVIPSNPNWDGSSGVPYDKWTVQLSSTPDEAVKILDKVKATLASEPVFLSSSEIGGQVAGDTQERAIAALLFSLVGIVGYIWFRFQRVVWGLATVLALVHDVLMMLAAIALSKWLAPIFGFAQIEEFKINLTVVAAFLTLVGYSTNDTIVTFDRIREIRGKSPDMTVEMINLSINQTLSRTILTALTTFLVVFVLYVIGGETIHAFAFSLVIGVFVGTYSSIFIAAPVLLTMSISGNNAQTASGNTSKKS